MQAVLCMQYGKPLPKQGYWQHEQWDLKLQQKSGHRKATTASLTVRKIWNNCFMEQRLPVRRKTVTRLEQMAQMNYVLRDKYNIGSYLWNVVNEPKWLN